MRDRLSHGSFSAALDAGQQHAFGIRQIQLSRLVGETLSSPQRPGFHILQAAHGLKARPGWAVFQ